MKITTTKGSIIINESNIDKINILEDKIFILNKNDLSGHSALLKGEFKTCDDGYFLNGVITNISMEEYINDETLEEFSFNKYLK